MGQGQRMYDVPPLGVPFVLRGRKGVSAVLDAFAPTAYDAWVGRVAAPLSDVEGVPSAPLPPGTGPVVARAVVVRLAGDVAGRSWLRRPDEGLAAADPPPEPLVGVVVEPAGATLVWVRGTPGEVAAALSRPDWRAYLG